MATTVPPLDPLPFTEPIADSEGRPTDFFIRQWNAQRDLNSNNVDISDELDALEVIVNDTRQIDLIAGTGLSGGGDLTGSDRTFDLEDTAVSPGSFGDAENVSKITVDAQGRITSAEDVFIERGDLFAWPAEIGGAFSGVSAAFKGAYFEPIIDITVREIALYFTPTAGHTYKAGVYRLDGSDLIDEITGESADIASPGTFAAGTTLLLPLAANATMVTGNRYVIAVGRIDGADTFQFPVSVEAINARTTPYPNVPFKPYPTATANVGVLAEIADATPGIGTSVNVVPTGTTFGIGFKFFI